MLRTGDSASGGSSTSDSTTYADFCRLAASDSQVFARFRRSLYYRPILEHVSHAMGQRYLDVAVAQTPDLVDFLRPAILLDRVGDPITASYPNFGTCSPTALRYLKVLSDLQVRYGGLDENHVVEVGVGYGGLVRLALLAWPRAAFDLVDLPAALHLSERYLVASGADLSRVRFLPSTASDQVSSDLFLSNYAFSELKRGWQDHYLQAYVYVASRGYVTYNEVAPSSWGSLSASEFAALAGGHLRPESPLSAPGNVIVEWEHRKEQPEGP